MVFAGVCAVGFVVLLFGVKLVPQWAKEREEAFLNRDPVHAAQNDYARGELPFLRIWTHSHIGKKRTGAWEVAGKEIIDPEILARNPDRLDLRITERSGMPLEDEHLQREARLFAYRYNLEAARLLSPESGPDE